MDTANLLITAGLNELQAKAYILLLDKGSITPPQASKNLGITRTNAYKLLDRLVEMQLARRVEIKKKFTYEPDNPLGLSTLAAEQRNRAAAQENAVKQVLDKLQAQYQQHNEQPSVRVVTGKQAVSDAYRQQIDQLQPIYFVRSRSDIVSMGFDTMHEIRVLPARHNIQRFGITPDITKGPVNPDSDKRSNLKRTWVKNEDYNTPVEWSVSGSTLLIVVFGNEPHAITISSPLVALAFKQLWAILDSCLRAMPYYNSLPRIS